MLGAHKVPTPAQWAILSTQWVVFSIEVVHN